MEQQAYKITMTKHYMKECDVIVVGEYTPKQAMERGLEVIDNCQHREGPLEYLGELDEFSIKNVNTKQN